jgi:hypothetical protein
MSSSTSSSSDGEYDFKHQDHDKEEGQEKDMNHQTDGNTVDLTGLDDDDEDDGDNSGGRRGNAGRHRTSLMDFSSPNLNIGKKKEKAESLSPSSPSMVDEKKTNEAQEEAPNPSEQTARTVTFAEAINAAAAAAHDDDDERKQTAGERTKTSTDPPEEDDDHKGEEMDDLAPTTFVPPTAGKNVTFPLRFRAAMPPVIAAAIGGEDTAAATTPAVGTAATAAAGTSVTLGFDMGRHTDATTTMMNNNKRDDRSTQELIRALERARRFGIDNESTKRVEAELLSRGNNNKPGDYGAGTTTSTTLVGRHIRNFCSSMDRTCTDDAVDVASVASGLKSAPPDRRCVGKDSDCANITAANAGLKPAPTTVNPTETTAMATSTFKSSSSEMIGTAAATNSYQSPTLKTDVVINLRADDQKESAWDELDQAKSTSDQKEQDIVEEDSPPADAVMGDADDDALGVDDGHDIRINRNGKRPRPFKKFTSFLKRKANTLYSTATSSLRKVSVAGVVRNNRNAPLSSESTGKDSATTAAAAASANIAAANPKEEVVYEFNPTDNSRSVVETPPPPVKTPDDEPMPDEEVMETTPPPAKKAKTSSDDEMMMFDKEDSVSNQVVKTNTTPDEEVVPTFEENQENLSGTIQELSAPTTAGKSENRCMHRPPTDITIPSNPQSST